MVSELFSFKADSCDAWPLLRSAQASARTCGTSAYENLVFPKPLSLGRQRAKLPPRDLNTYISHSRVFVCHSSAIGGGHESSCSHGPCLALSCCNSPRVKPEEGVRALAKTFGYHRRHFKIDDLRLCVSVLFKSVLSSSNDSHRLPLASIFHWASVQRVACEAGACGLSF